MDVVTPNADHHAPLDEWGDLAAACLVGARGVAATVDAMERLDPERFREMGKAAAKPIGLLWNLWQRMSAEQLLEVASLREDELDPTEPAGQAIAWAMGAVARRQWEEAGPPPFDPRPKAGREWAEAARGFLAGRLSLVQACRRVVTVDLFHEIVGSEHHPLRESLGIVEAFFVQLEPEQQRGHAPIDQRFQDAYATGLAAAWMRLAQADRRPLLP